jgi:hypothetical protein
MIDLANDINDDTARMLYDAEGNKLTIEVQKASPGPWERLALTPAKGSSSSAAAAAAAAAATAAATASGAATLPAGTMDKAALQARRNASIAARQEKEAKNSAAKQDALREQARQSVRAQMDVEDRQRRFLENAKEEQKKAAEVSYKNKL